MSVQIKRLSSFAVNHQSFHIGVVSLDFRFHFDILDTVYFHLIFIRVIPAYIEVFKTSGITEAAKMDSIRNLPDSGAFLIISTNHDIGRIIRCIIERFHVIRIGIRFTILPHLYLTSPIGTDILGKIKS